MRSFESFFKSADPATATKKLKAGIVARLADRYSLDDEQIKSEVDLEVYSAPFDGYTIRCSISGARNSFNLRCDEIELRDSELPKTVDSLFESMLRLDPRAIDEWGMKMRVLKGRSYKSSVSRDPWKYATGGLVPPRREGVPTLSEYVSEHIMKFDAVRDEYRPVYTKGPTELKSKSEKEMDEAARAKAEILKAATDFRGLVAASNEANAKRERNVKDKSLKSYNSRPMTENYDRIVRCVNEVNTMIQLADFGEHDCTMDVTVGPHTLHSGLGYQLSGIKYAPRRRELYAEARNDDGEAAIVGLDDIVDAFESFGDFIKDEVENAGLFVSLAELQDHAYLATEDGEAVAQALADDIMSGLNTALARKVAQKAVAAEKELARKEHYGAF